MTNADLIVHGRTMHVLPTCNCTHQLADALEVSIEAEHDAERRFAAMLNVEASLRRSLEASEAQVVRLRAMFEAHEKMYHRGVPTVFPWPADLLEAVRVINTNTDGVAVCDDARATLTRYGLIEGVAK